MFIKYIQCYNCKNFIGKKSVTNNKFCGAFKSIPEEILTGEHDHTKPYKGDNGITFEPIEDD